MLVNVSGNSLYIWQSSYNVWNWALFDKIRRECTHYLRCVYITHGGGALLVRHNVPNLEINSALKVGNYVYLEAWGVMFAVVTISTNCIFAAVLISSTNISDIWIIHGITTKFVTHFQVFLKKIKQNH